MAASRKPDIAFDDEQFDLIERLVDDWYADPLGFVLFAFPWGQGALAKRDGPMEWQADVLRAVGAAVKENAFDGVHPVDAVREAVASGHGIGKSALVAWLIIWIMATRPHAKGVVTATTVQQLEDKTWAELAKWLAMSIVADVFKLTTGRNNLRMFHKLNPDTWRVSGQTCKEENSEAFAGQHNVNSTSFYIFDEGAGVPDKIYEVAEGGLTDGEPMIFVFGNPTRNSGRFAEIFGRQRHRWTRWQIDSRNVPITNKRLIQEWIEDYGEDGDFVRVRVKGQFPRSGSIQFIDSELVTEAVKRKPQPLPFDAVVIGVDVARFGDDQSVIFVRQGNDGRIRKVEKYRGIDLMALSGRVAELAREIDPDAIFIDDVGVGGGVTDRLRQIGCQVTPVNGGTAAEDVRIFFNKRAECWGRMRDWLRSGGAIPDDPELIAELTSLEYGHSDRQQIKLEKKERLKKRGLASPDTADALALTFAAHVTPRFKRRPDYDKWTDGPRWVSKEEWTRNDRRRGLDSDAHRYTLDYAGD